MGKNSFIKYYFPPILWAGLIFFVSSLPSESIQKIGVSFDDFILHTIEYSIFGFLLSRAFLKENYQLNWKINIMIILIGVLYGLSDEFHQSFVPGRYTELSDFIADSSGVMIGLILFLFKGRIIQKSVAHKQ